MEGLDGTWRAESKLENSDGDRLLKLIAGGAGGEEAAGGRRGGAGGLL